ncbi:MAG TPA: 50S ribosomal protein L11 methyltransferase [Povalibacter sp.]
MDIFSNLMAIGECLLDSPRTQAFKRAIDDTVRTGDTVMDVGTGSGILAMFSARAGAHRVRAIEITPEIALFARQNVAHNGLGSIVKVEQQDATTLAGSQPVDVVTMELMDTWLVAEQQAAVMNQLHASGIIGSRTRIIPKRYQCLIRLVNYDFSFYGFQLPFVIQARNYMAQDHIRHQLSAASIVHDMAFHKQQSLRVDKQIEVPIEKDGQCNAAVLTARVFLTDDVHLGATSDLNMPVIVPLEHRRVRRGDHLSLDIAYEMGAGFGDFSMHWAAQRMARMTG